MSLVSNAQDLPEGFQLTQRLSSVQVLATKGAQITNPDIDKTVTANGTFARATGVLEIDANVEGNLCSGKPEGVAFASEWVSANRFRLTVWNAHQSDPYSKILTACLSYSAPRNIKAALKVFAFVKNEEVAEQTYVIPQGYPSQNLPDAVITVRYTIADGFSTTLK